MYYDITIDTKIGYHYQIIQNTHPHKDNLCHCYELRPNKLYSYNCKYGSDIQLVHEYESIHFKCHSNTLIKLLVYVNLRRT